MKYTVTQRIISEDGDVDWLRYYLEAENEEKARAEFLEKILPKHLTVLKRGWVAWREPMIREYAESDEYSLRLEMIEETSASDKLMAIEMSNSRICELLENIERVLLLFAIGSIINGIAGLFR